MTARDQRLVGEAGHPQPAQPRPAGRFVDEVDHPGAGEDHPPALRPLAQEPQLGRLDAAQRQLLVGLHEEAGVFEIDGVAEPPVVQPHAALAFEALHPGAARGGDRDAVGGSGAAGERGVRQARGGQIQGAFHGQLRGVQCAAAEGVAQPAAAQAQRDADGGAAQRQLAVGLQHLGLEVLGDGQAVRHDRAALAVLVRHDLIEHQVGAYVGVGEPYAVLHHTARQVQIALRLEPGGLQPGDRAVHQPQGGEPALGQYHLGLEPAVPQLDEWLDRAARKVESVRDVRTRELERRDPPRLCGRPFEEQQRQHPGPHPPLGSPQMLSVRIVAGRVPDVQIAGTAVAEGLPHAPFRRCQPQVGGRIAVCRTGHLDPPFPAPVPRVVIADASPASVRLYGSLARSVTG